MLVLTVTDCWICLSERLSVKLIVYNHVRSRYGEFKR